MYSVTGLRIIVYLVIMRNVCCKGDKTVNIVLLGNNKHGIPKAGFCHTNLCTRVLVCIGCAIQSLKSATPSRK